MTDTLTHKLSWRLRVMMAERNISTATHLQRLLGKSGYFVTSSQLTRVIKERPERISTDLLDHLLEILDCDIDDLLRKDPVSVEGVIPEKSSNKYVETTKPKKERVRREPIANSPEVDMTGPKVTAIPFPSRKK
jgi:DNA-binding Xre family transcriptional regulator